MESVWEYPRPPALVPCEQPVRVEFGGVTIAESSAALRVLETSHPPTIYIPPDDVMLEYLRPAGHRTYCEWKGFADYFDLEVEGRVEPAVAWHYREPTRRFAQLRDHISLYPGRMDACFVGDERVAAQPGDFYGGWITSDIQGPFKGAPGTVGW